MGRKRRKVFKHFRVDVDQIVPMIWTGYKKKLKLINLKDTPHYQYLQGHTEPYANYADEVVQIVNTLQKNTMI